MYKDIDLDENIIPKNNIPVLTRDINWIELFGNVEDMAIKNDKNQLEKLLTENREIETKIQQMQKEKLKCISMILEVSNAINNEDKVEDVGLLDEHKYRIKDINDAIDELTFRLETIPKEIRDANYQLLKSTVIYGYSKLKKDGKKLEQVTAEFDELRERLKLLIDEKNDYEESINSIYTFLHGMLGSKEMERLDNQILE